ncbi:MAG TPA: helix-turn-helix domain-containing protein [Solirubrobacteraceae bacterium]|nr:helix-turn-helix domain-containing protein [Solirubrobacteraceae bacterium]
MSRWKPDARGRLARAAMELYGEHGFEQTTVAEIAARAGLTERTFFRHFADKREVLFEGAAALEARLVDGVVAAPADAAPIEVVAAALRSIAPIFAERRPFARQRQAIVAANPELRERELIKLAALAAAVTAALHERGVDEPQASLAAEAGIAVFRIGFDRWVAACDDGAELGEVMDELFGSLSALVAAGVAPRKARR